MATSLGIIVDQMTSLCDGSNSAIGEGSGCQSSGDTPGTQSRSSAKTSGLGMPSAMIAK